jgi:hypothetical protein
MSPDDVLSRLEEVLMRLERMSLEHKVVDPKREQELDALLEETRAIVREVHGWMAKHDDNRRFAQILEEIGKSIVTTEKRLAVSEARLECVEDTAADRGGSAFKADPEIIAEGAWIVEQLAGPSPTGVDVRFLKDAHRSPVPPAVDLLRSQLAQPPAQSGAKGKTP